MERLSLTCLFICFLVVVNLETALCENHDGSRIKRESRPAEFFLGNEHHKLNLRYAGHDHVVMVPAKLNVWAVKSTPWTSPNYTYYKFGNAEKILDKYRIYEDLDKRATLVAYYDDNYIYYDGVIGESGEMRPVKRAKENWWNENLIDEDKISKPSRDKPLYYDLPKGNDVQQPYLSDEKMDKPLDVMYPKILLVVDHSLFKKLGSSYGETLKYLLIYWNAVNMRFKEIEWPQVNIEITGIIIAEDEDAMHYISQARDSKNPNDVSGHKVMNKGRDYFRETFKNETNFRNFDTTVVMTSLNSGALLGSAWIGQVCSRDFNIVFVYDDATYLGIPTGTHEIGHHMGMPHDGELDASGNKKPCSSQTVSDEFGTVMSPVAQFYKKKLMWTECSKQSLAKFAWLKDADCLRHRHRF